MSVVRAMQLEQVRVQERSKSEENTSILNQLQHFQYAESESESPAPANGGGGEDGDGELSATAGAVGGHTDGPASGEGGVSQPGESNNDGLLEAAEEEARGDGLSRVAVPTEAQ